MNQEQRWIAEEVRRWAEAAYGAFAQHFGKSDRWLESRFDARDWEQVLMGLGGHRDSKAFPEELEAAVKMGLAALDRYEVAGQREAMEKLGNEEKRIIGECLHAAARGPFFPDWEFSILFGLKREEVESVAAAWPEVDANDTRVGRAINNSMNMLFGYPHRKWDCWDDFISVPPWWAWNVYQEFRKWSGRRDTGRAKGAVERTFSNFE